MTTTTIPNYKENRHTEVGAAGVVWTGISELLY